MDRKTYEAEMERALNEFAEKLKNQSQPVEGGGASPGQDYKERFTELERQHVKAVNNLKNLKGAGEQDWPSVKKDLDRQWRDLRQGHNLLDEKKNKARKIS
ncbi:MAG: hypothetical protein WAN36_13785 [Calditrichia bacterium]